MGINFPNAPTIGQLYPSPATPGLPVYQWDGEKWTTGPPNIPDGLVHYDAAQSLTSSQLIQARQNIYAAPFDAMGWSGMQVNGGILISQENGTNAVAFPTGTQTKPVVDGWNVSKTGTSALSVWQAASGLSGYPFCLYLYTSTAQTTIGTDYARFQQKIEGYRFSRVCWGTSVAMPVSIGFWFSATLAGTYRAIMYNFDGSTLTPWVTFSYTTTGSWQWISVQFAAITTGTWKTDNSIGAYLEIEVASSATPNILGVVGQYASITGVVVLPGVEAPSATRSPLIMRPYDQELLTCQRYFQLNLVGRRFYAPTASTMDETIIYLKSSMRASPNHTIITNVQQSANMTYNVLQYDLQSMRLVCTSTAIGDCYLLLWSKFDARL